MDDEMPLSALSKPKKQNLDDDLPLAKLATPGGAKPRASTGGSAAGAGKAKPRAAGTKRKESSSSSSDSSSSSSDSSSSESGGKKKASKKARLRLIAKKKAAAPEGDPEENEIRKKQRTPKEQVVVDLLCRWWYVMDDWPPKDPAFYDALLEKQKLRRVSIQEWEWVPDIDKEGRGKVYELSQFKGIFRKSDNEKVDLRPHDLCPSFNNLISKDLPTLYSMLVEAYEKQIKDLERSNYDEKVLADSLKAALTRIREKAYTAKQMAGLMAKKH